jgi:hypothetical protein
MVENINKKIAIPYVAKEYLEFINSKREKELGSFVEESILKAAADQITGIGGKKYTHIQISGGDVIPVIGREGEEEKKVIMTVEELERLSEED